MKTKEVDEKYNEVLIKFKLHQVTLLVRDKNIRNYISSNIFDSNIFKEISKNKETYHYILISRTTAFRAI